MLYKVIYSVSHFHYIKASSFNAISNKARQYYRTQIFNFYASGRRPFLMLFWCIQKILEWRLYRKISPRSNMSRFNSHTINQIIEMVALQIVISFPVMKTNFILINIKIANNTLIIIRRLIGPIHLLAVIRYHNVNMNSRKYSSTISMMHQWSLVVSRSSTISSS